jgi:hypothetical protein
LTPQKRNQSDEPVTAATANTFLALAYRETKNTVSIFHYFDLKIYQQSTYHFENIKHYVLRTMVMVINSGRDVGVLEQKIWAH